MVTFPVVHANPTVNLTGSDYQRTLINSSSSQLGDV
jgi:hypothetical protein